MSRLKTVLKILLLNVSPVRLQATRIVSHVQHHKTQNFKVLLVVFNVHVLVSYTLQLLNYSRLPAAFPFELSTVFVLFFTRKKKMNRRKKMKYWAKLKYSCHWWQFSQPNEKNIRTAR